MATKNDEDSTQTEQRQLTELTLEAQAKAEEIGELVKDLHKHKAATEANRVALGSEVKELKKKHKVLKKQVEAYDKAQKKGKVGGLGGFAKGISKALFKPEEAVQASVPPVEVGLNEAPPEYCDDPIEANIVEAEVFLAKHKAADKARTAQAAAAEAEEALRQQEDPTIRNDPARLVETQEHADVLTRVANLAGGNANKAREEYEQLGILFS